MQLCANSPLPTLDGLLKSFKPTLSFPPSLSKLPSLSAFLPALPYPLLSSLNVPNLELTMAAIELQAFQLATTAMAMIKPIIAKLGIPLLSFLPKIPGLPGCTLVDLLEGKADKLLAAVKAALARGLTLPMLPFPIYPTLKIPDIEAAHALQSIIANYMFLVITAIAGIVQQVVGKFKGMPHPSLPVFPTPDAILKAVLAMAPAIPALPSLPGVPAIPAVPALPAVPGLPGVPKLPSYSDMLNGIKAIPNFDISAMLAMVSLPAMPKFPSLPNPLVPSFKFPDIELALHMLSFNINLQLGLLKPIMDFILSTLGKVLTFKFPVMCMSLPGLPTIAVPSIPPIPSIT